MGSLFGGGGGMSSLFGGGSSAPQFGPGSPTFDITNPNLGAGARMAHLGSSLGQGLSNPGGGLQSALGGQSPQQLPGLPQMGTELTQAPQTGSQIAAQQAQPRITALKALETYLRPSTATSPAATLESKGADRPAAASLTGLDANPHNRISQIVSASKQTYGNSPQAQLAAAQAILESRLLGNPSSLAAKHNNLFGIKGSGTAGSATLNTKEYMNGRMISLPQQFAANKTLADSFAQHKSLMGKSRYKDVLGAQSFEEAARAVKQAGYATDPNYVRSLTNIYNSYLRDKF